MIEKRLIGWITHQSIAVSRAYFENLFSWHYFIVLLTP